MNKVLIVGHPSSGYHEVEVILHRYGLGTAKASRREGLTPFEISQSLLKAHGAPSLRSVLSEDEFMRIEPGAVWHGMALDLMLGNIDQPLWGWSDPQNIFLLDYWASLDPRLTFVLVYTEPQRALMEAAQQGNETPATDEIEQLIDNWVAFNGALLRFFLRNPKRCLLVHSQQVSCAVDSYLGRLQPLLETPLVCKQLQHTSAAEAIEDEVEIQKEWPLQAYGRLTLPENLA
ncbi:MAG: hypothetical protein FNT29_11365, partial [Halothiobacillaceae bacterium]